MNVTVIACLKYYSQLIPPFVRFFNRYWPGQAFAIAYDEPGETWSQSLMRELSHLIETEESTILLLDDYILSDRVDVASVYECWKHLVNHREVGFVRLNPCPGPTLSYEHPLLGKFDRDADYLVSLQPSIWRIECLLELLDAKESAWDFEINGTKRARDSRWEFLGTYENLISINNLMRRGVLQEDVLEWMEQQG